MHQDAFPGEDISDRPLPEIAGLPARLAAPHPGLPRLWFVRVESGLRRAMERMGAPIRYGYLEAPYPPVEAYQTLFARVPGSAEMPSAGRPYLWHELGDSHLLLPGDITAAREENTT